VKFQVVNRQRFDSAKYMAAYTAWAATEPRNPATKPILATYLMGSPTLPAPEETGWKDTAKAYPGEVLKVKALFEVPAGAATIPGSGTSLPATYVYHCHILEHEENDMMRPFEVQA